AYVGKGITAVDHALQIKSDYMDALVYKGLLLRLQATLEKEAAKQPQLLKDAEKISQQANDLRKKKAAGTNQQQRNESLDPRPPGVPGGLSFCTAVTTPQGKITRSFGHPFRGSLQ